MIYFCFCLCVVRKELETKNARIKKFEKNEKRLSELVVDTNSSLEEKDSLCKLLFRDERRYKEEIKMLREEVDTRYLQYKNLVGEKKLSLTK